jgi:hypothetical protein
MPALQEAAGILPSANSMPALRTSDLRRQRSTAQILTDDDRRDGGFMDSQKIKDQWKMLTGVFKKDTATPPPDTSRVDDDVTPSRTNT